MKVSFLNVGLVHSGSVAAVDRLEEAEIIYRGIGNESRAPYIE